MRPNKRPSPRIGRIMGRASHVWPAAPGTGGGPRRRAFAHLDGTHAEERS